MEGIDIEKIKYLRRVGVITHAGLHRAIIIKDYLKRKGKETKINIYYDLSLLHNKSEFSIRNIIQEFERHQ